MKPIIRKIGESHLLVFPNRSYYKDNSLFVLNESMVAIADMFYEGRTVSEILHKLCSLYPDISFPQLEKDILDAINSLHDISSQGESESEMVSTISLASEEKLKELHDIVWNDGLPFYVGIEPTSECNFRCKHCFALKDEVNPVSLEEWKRIIDDLVRIGCLYLTITGGEPLMFREFKNLYLHAKKRGLIVTVYTNASMMNEDISKLFLEFPPKQIDVSIYGASEQSYYEVTGNKSSYKNVMTGLELLSALRHKSRIFLKAVIMKDNVHELSIIQKIAEYYGLPLCINSVIRPKIDGATENTLCRIKPSETVDLEMRIAKNAEAWEEYLNGKSMACSDSDQVECTAGDVAFHINSKGEANFCVLYREPKLNVFECNLGEIWNTIKKRRNSFFRKAERCINCQYSKCCDYCPASGFLDENVEESSSTYVCDIAKNRYEFLQNFN